jgi:hypothetical protein
MLRLMKLATIALASLGLAFGAAAQTAKRTAAPDKVSIHVDENRPEVMTLALNNVQNILAEYKKLGRKVLIEVVTYGPGLHMLRDDTSPVKARITAMALEHEEVTFAACGNTRANMGKAEQKDVKIMSEARVVPSGVVHLVELQKAGYAYIKP